MDLTLPERLPHEGRRPYAYRAIRENIISLNLQPGAVLNENELCDIFQTSRTPIHEALLMLKEESLVEIYPQSRSLVSKIDLNLLKEGHFMRATLEPLILQQVAGNVRPEILAEMGKNLEQQEAVMAMEGNLSAFSRLDDEFHNFIYLAGNKPHICKVTRNVCSHYDRVRYLDTMTHEQDYESIYQDHRRIHYWMLIGIEHYTEVKSFYDRHLGRYLEHFQQQLADRPDYFHA